MPTNIRTNENEIQAYISNKYRSKSRHMLFYILYCNDEVIGYAEIGALLKQKLSLLIISFWQTHIEIMLISICVTICW